MTVIQIARHIETVRGWKIDDNSIVVMANRPGSWMGMACTTKLGECGIPERQFAIHVVGEVVQPIHADTVAELHGMLAERDRARCKTLHSDLPVASEQRSCAA
jgi:hypothetical protein